MPSQRILIIGAGLVGLGTAYQWQLRYPDSQITVLEKESEPAVHQSGHNSGVIHSGIYYKPGSLKAQNCLSGYQLLTSFCEQYDLPHKICGKLIVSSDANESLQLHLLNERAIANGLKGVRLLSSEEAKEKEPFVRAHSGLWVPQTGIIDFKAVARQLVYLLREKGAAIEMSQQVREIRRIGTVIEVATESHSFQADIVVNCAGLFSDRIAEMSGLKLQHRIIPFKGEYWMLNEATAAKINGLIYPVPDPELPFLGVHLTRMINGEVEAGPNALLAFKREGYEKAAFSWKDTFHTLTFPGFWRMAQKFYGSGVDEWYRSMSKAAFTKALQKLVPDITENDLLPAPSGVRAQALGKDGQLVDDFLILQSKDMIHVCNAPSPAATSCLAIGNYITGLYAGMNQC